MIFLLNLFEHVQYFYIKRVLKMTRTCFFKKIKMSDLFNLLFSDNPETIEQASKLLIVLSISNPNVFLDNFEEIKLIIFSLCCSPTPSFQAINILISCIVNSIDHNIEFYKKFLIPLLQLSKEILNCYFSTELSSIRYYPDIYPISMLIENFMNNGYALEYDVFVQICEILSMGFIPSNPFHDLILDNIDDIVDLISNAYSNGLPVEPLFLPLQSQNIKVATSFIVISLFCLSQIGNKEGIISAILSHAANISSYEEYLSSALSYLPLFLLYAASSDDNTFPKIQDLIRRSEDSIISALMREREKSRRRGTVVEKDNAVIFAIHRAQIKVKEQQTLFARKWVDHWLTLLEEPQILLWSNEKYTNKGGVVYLLSEISSVEFLPEKTLDNGHGNIMKLTRGKEVFSISFNSYEEAMQWRNIFKQYNKAIN